MEAGRLAEARPVCVVTVIINEHENTQNDQDEIDYLHPDGKPDSSKTPVDKEDAKPSTRNMRKALEEADGHYKPRKDPYLHDR